MINRLVSGFAYLAEYEPEKLILEEYKMARTLFDQDYNLKYPTKLQVIALIRSNGVIKGQNSTTRNSTQSKLQHFS